MRFWWVRHGPTHARCMVGWQDLPADLSDHGALARLAAHLPPDAPVVSSDLQRARATADAIQLDRPRLPDDPRLREFHQGDWEGLPFDEISRRWPSLSRRYWEAPGDVAPPGGESWNQGAARVGQAVDALIALQPGRDVILVAHHGAILTQFARASGQSPLQALAQPIGTLSVTCLGLTQGGAWQVDCVNLVP